METFSEVSSLKAAKHRVTRHTQERLERTCIIITYPGIGKVGSKCNHKGDKYHKGLNDIGMLNDTNGIILLNINVESVDGDNQDDGRKDCGYLCFRDCRSVEVP